MSGPRWGLVLVIITVGGWPALGNIIVPNDDAYIAADGNNVPHDNMGLNVRTDSPRRTDYIEFTIPSDAATALSASLVLYQTNAGMTYTNISFKSDVVTIDETTLTWNNRPEVTWVPPATFPTTVCPSWKPADGTTGSVSLSVLDWFKSQAGKTLTIKLRNDNPANNTHGPAIFEDREGSLGYGVSNGPHINWTPFPEPAAFLTMLLASMGLVLRRRCK